jgi:hypothetical protein
MTVQIAPKSTQHTGMALSTQGSVAAWEVTFHLDGDESSVQNWRRKPKALCATRRSMRKAK